MSRERRRKVPLSTREFIGIKDVGEDSILTGHGELILFAVKPTNLSVCSPESVGARIYALVTVLKGLPELELLALNSRESYEDNKRYYRQRAGEETLPAVARLLEQDAQQLDRLQVQMATAREFYVLVRLKKEHGNDRSAFLARVLKNLEETGFHARQSGKEELKRMLAVYFEQNVTTEKFEDIDGERWIILGD